MVQPVIFLSFILLLLSCSSHKKIQASDVLPKCLSEKIEVMAADASQGAPQSVTSYTYKNKKVYYMVASCCDKFNTVYDSACNVLGHPDGGFTGRGDGSMNDFRNEATNEKVVWQKK